MTGGRIKRIRDYLTDDEAFFLTYGDGVAILIYPSFLLSTKLMAARDRHQRLAAGRFGALELEGNLVKNFREKPAGDGASINGGFFVLSPKSVGTILKGIPRFGSASRWKHSHAMGSSSPIRMEVFGRRWIR